MVGDEFRLLIVVVGVGQNKNKLWLLVRLNGDRWIIWLTAEYSMRFGEEF